MKLNVIRALRAGRHISQNELARQAGIDRARLQRIEYGIRQASAQERNAIAGALGVEAHVLFPRRGGDE